MAKLTGKAKAKARKAKAQANTKQLTSTEGYRPDAGLNSKEGSNYYWLQVAEMLQSLAIASPRVVNYEGKHWLELSAPVDIMDKEGKNHTAEQTAKGYFATFRLSIDQVQSFAEQISKGAMSVRVQGVPSETQQSPFGEDFRVIEVMDSWSAGNNSNYMSYMVMAGGQMIKDNSDHLSDWFKQAAVQMAA